MNEYIEEARNELRRADRANNPDAAGHSLRAAHVHAMLAVAAEIADLHQTIGKYLEAQYNPPRVVGDHLVWCTPEPALTEPQPIAYREGDRIRSKEGHGYGDMVADEQIEAHIEAACQDGENFPGFIEFAQATLRLRAFERAVQ